MCISVCTGTCVCVFVCVCVGVDDSASFSDDICSICFCACKGDDVALFFEITPLLILLLLFVTAFGGVLVVSEIVAEVLATLGELASVKVVVGVDVEFVVGVVGFVGVARGVV